MASTHATALCILLLHASITAVFGGSSPPPPPPCNALNGDGGWTSWSYTPWDKPCDGVIKGHSRTGTRVCCSGTCPGGNTQYQWNCCDINGGWSTWGAYGPWTATCGTSTRVRTRTCTNPEQNCYGQTCAGASSQTQTMLPAVNCPVNGGWSAWSIGTWTGTCGSVSRTNTRSCTNPAPLYGGTACVGATSLTETRSTCCPVNGAWTAWSVGGAWSATCGAVTRDRSRSCTSPAPSCGGAACAGTSITTDTQTTCCPVDGSWSVWSFGLWSTSCGYGIRSKTRTCVGQSCNGAACVGATTGEESRTTCCPVNAGWTAWTIGAWSASCGAMSRTDTRACTNPSASCGGATCVGLSTAAVSQSTCCPQNGVWSAWTLGVWSATCGYVTRVNTRTCNGQACNGNPCTGSPTATESRDTCCPVNGAWSAWGTGAWSGACGSVTRTDSRTCTAPTPSCGGATCSGLSTRGAQQSTCCPVDGVWSAWTYTSWSGTCGSVTRTLTRQCVGQSCGGATCAGVSTMTDSQTTCCPVNGQWSAWSMGTWSSTCGVGSRTNTRTCVGTACNGALCPGNTQAVESRETCCPINGAWSSWSYGAWSASCGSVTRADTRSCSMPAPFCGGTGCTGATTKTVPQSTCCPVDGQWSPWTMGTWSATCGTMVRTNIRTCTGQSCGGAYCPGASTQPETISQCCPVDGVWSTWAFGQWSASCGSASRSKTRTCTAPSCNGLPCAGLSQDTDSQNTCCPVDGAWSAWAIGTWSSTCGVGLRSDTRTCTSPSASCGGAGCPGVGERIVTRDSCCPVNGAWSIWAAASYSLVGCGNLSQPGTRTCTSPAPSCGGTPCVGDTYSGNATILFIACPDASTVHSSDSSYMGVPIIIIVCVLVVIALILVLLIVAYRRKRSKKYYEQTIHVPSDVLVPSRPHSHFSGGSGALGFFDDVDAAYRFRMFGTPPYYKNDRDPSVIYGGSSSGSIYRGSQYGGKFGSGFHGAQSMKSFSQCPRLDPYVNMTDATLPPSAMLTPPRYHNNPLHESETDPATYDRATNAKNSYEYLHDGSQSPKIEKKMSMHSLDTNGYLKPSDVRAAPNIESQRDSSCDSQGQLIKHQSSTYSKYRDVEYHLAEATVDQYFEPAGDGDAGAIVTLSPVTERSATAKYAVEHRL